MVIFKKNNIAVVHLITPDGVLDFLKWELPNHVSFIFTGYNTNGRARFVWLYRFMYSIKNCAHFQNKLGFFLEKTKFAHDFSQCVCRMFAEKLQFLYRMG